MRIEAAIRTTRIDMKAWYNMPVTPPHPPENVCPHTFGREERRNTTKKLHKNTKKKLNTIKTCSNRLRKKIIQIRRINNVAKDIEMCDGWNI